MKYNIPLTDIPKIIFLLTIRHIIPYIPLNLKYFLADKIADSFISKTRHPVISNEIKKLSGADYFSEKQLLKIARDTDSNVKKDIFETWSYPQFNKKFFEQICQIEGQQHLDKALSEGNGVLIALCHFGSYKMLLPVLGFKGYKITQIAANPLEFIDRNSTLANKMIMEIEQNYEKSLPANFIYAKRFNREIFRVLQRGEILVVSLDGIKAAKREILPFLKRKIRLSPSIVQLSLKTKAPILPIFTVRDKNNTHRLIIHKQINISPEDPDPIMKFLNKFVYLMEIYIKKYPCHYAWFLYKNKTNPPSIGSIFID